MRLEPEEVAGDPHPPPRTAYSPPNTGISVLRSYIYPHTVIIDAAPRRSTLAHLSMVKLHEFLEFMYDTWTARADGAEPVSPSRSAPPRGLTQTLNASQRSIFSRGGPYIGHSSGNRDDISAQDMEIASSGISPACTPSSTSALNEPPMTLERVEVLWSVTETSCNINTYCARAKDLAKWIDESNFASA